MIVGVAFKQYIVFFLVVLLVGCATAPGTNKAVEGCNSELRKSNVQQKEFTKQELLAASKEIDQLEEEIALQRLKLRRPLPRRHFVGARAKSADVALYMAAWVIKVEEFGNKNYPEEARNNHFYGKVQLTASIKSEGNLEKVKIDKSSGCKILDDHALSIVRGAAPYSAFSKTMKKRFDILSIIRTFTYTKEDVLPLTTQDKAK